MKYRKKCVGKNAKRSNREKERKVLQRVDSSDSKLLTGLTAVAQVSRIGYYWSLISGLDLSFIRDWLMSLIT